MTEDYLRREVSIADYCFMVQAESVLIHRSGRRYLVHAPASPAARPLGRDPSDRALEPMRCLVACVLAVLFCGTTRGCDLVRLLLFVPVRAIRVVTLRVAIPFVRTRANPELLRMRGYKPPA